MVSARWGMYGTKQDKAVSRAGVILMAPSRARAMTLAFVLVRLVLELVGSSVICVCLAIMASTRAGMIVL